ncbi:MAG: formate hydrogenlyase complex iron-sulfur subunit [Chloroflexota bacterium]
MVLKLIKEVLRVGEATHPYPFAPVDLAPGFRGKPEYNPEQCIACAACTIACPPNALGMETDLEHGTRTWSLFYGRCIFCARCEEVCPTGAIKLEPDFELASFSREDLTVTAEFRLAACSQCGAYFASAKELEHVLALLDQAGLPAGEEENRKALLRMCPECRRKTDLPRVKTVVQEAFDGRL